MNSLHPVFERALRPFAPPPFPNIGAAQQAALRPDALGTQARIALSEEELLAIDRYLAGPARDPQFFDRKTELYEQRSQQEAERLELLHIREAV